MWASICMLNDGNAKTVPSSYYRYAPSYSIFIIYSAEYIAEDIEDSKLHKQEGNKDRERK
jgi:hypothetical protein